VTGIDNHKMSQIKVVDAAAKVVTQKGPIIIIMNQYTFYGRGRTIHSLGQIEAYKNLVNDRSMRVEGGQQSIVTVDNFEELMASVELVKLKAIISVVHKCLH
jgi:hypothetical protein